MNEEELKRLLDGIGPTDGPEADDIDPRWESLAMGEASKDEVRRLHALAGTSNRQRDIADAFEPVDPELLRRVAEREVGRRPPVPAPVRFEVSPATMAGEGSRASWLDRLRTWLSTWRSKGLRAPIVIGPLVAFAAAVVLVLMPVQAHLPAYEAELRSGDQLTRGSPAQAPAVGALTKLTPGSRLDVVVRPAEPVTDGVSAAAFVMSGTSALPLGGQLEVDGRGSVRLTGTMGLDIVLPPGVVEIRVVVAAGDTVPTASDALAGGADGRVVVPVRFEVVDAR